MKAILVLALIAVAIFAVVCIVYFFIPAKNPMWIKKQLKNLEVGEVRWIKSTPKRGNGHEVALVREIEDGYIHYDIYEFRKGSWIVMTQRTRHTYKDFFAKTEGEPNFGEFLSK